MKGGKLDEVDVSLVHILLRDSRVGPDQLEEITGLDQGVIDERIAAMVRSGFLRRFTAKPSLVALGARSVLVWGKSRLRSLSDGLRAVEDDDRVAWIAHSASGRFYFALHLKSDDDLNERVSRLKNEAMMLRPSHGVRNLFGQEGGAMELTKLDWKVLGALAEDHTLTAEEIAPRIGKKESEVTASLEKLISAGAIEFSVDIDPNVVSNPLCLFHLESLEPDRVEVAAGELMQEHAPGLLFFNTFSNMPALTTAMLLGQGYEDILDLMRVIQERPEFPFFEVNPLLASTNVGTWRDTLLRKNGSSRS
jgi:DNA-binding Lrp family transcriptional regulator